jgi:hypothetical protein
MTQSPQENPDQPALDEIKSVLHQISSFPPNPTQQEIDAWMENADKLAIMEQRLNAKYLPRLYELAKPVIDANIQTDPAFAVGALGRLMRQSPRFHVFAGSTFNPKTSATSRQELEAIFTPEIVATIVGEMHEDVLQYVRENRDFDVKEIRNRLQQQRAEEVIALQKLLNPGA